ncbi:molybdenum cofactor guanylyltransferase [Clostridium sp. Cult2]|uniref:molybdenum cofactor guanylyltransferase n=1 Tax=Clostridium sp. Cult2 TaxID=2079003 RepID=UPI001F33A27B|nr:molybdenum cofactor guanylyltransferase [Clostridium sp. Cult2]MCF6466087.1 molybdenum cofactor guanylyltransferase [Clostridium sp. Cult2]
MKKFGTAVILAGGKSTRMGFDKQFLRINERRLIDNLRRKLSKLFDEIIVVTNKSEYYLGFTDKITKDIIVGKGPLSGIHAGLSVASSQYVYFVACDMPNINLDYIEYMKGELKNLEVKACITKYGEWIEPFNAFYSKDMIKDIEEHLLSNKKSVNSLLYKLTVYYIEEERAREFSSNWDMFLNLNTKDELNDFLKAQNSKKLR